MQKLKAAVVIPPVEDFYFSPRRFASLGALKAAEILENYGAEVKLYDFTSAGETKIMRKQKPAYLAYLDPFIIPEETGPCSFFTDYKRFGPSAEECALVIAQDSPDIVFFALFAYCYADSAVSLAAALKKLKPGLETAAAGAGVTVLPDYFKPHFDYVLPGEAEDCLENFLTGIKENGRKENPASCMEHTADFSPSVALTGSTGKALYLSVMLTRGCTKKCRFCSNFIVHGRKFRKSSLQLLVESLEKLKSSPFGGSRADSSRPCGSRPCGSRADSRLPDFAGKKILINFEDDNLLCDTEYFFEAIDILRDYFGKAAGDSGRFNNILFSAENGLDYSLLTEELCGRLIDQGFRQFNFTLGSIDSFINRMENRESDSDALKKILLYLDKRNIPAVSYFIAGLEHDSPEKAVESLLYLNRLPGLSGISMFYAVPGLPGFENHEKILTLPPGLFRGSSAYPWNSSLSTAQLITAFRISRTINFLQRKNYSPQDIILKDLIKKEKKLFTLIKKSGTVYPVRPPGIDNEMENLFFARAYLE